MTYTSVLEVGNTHYLYVLHDIARYYYGCLTFQMKYYFIGPPKPSKC